MISFNEYKNFIEFLVKNLYFIKKSKKNQTEKNVLKIYKYLFQIQSIINNEKKVFEFFLDDLSYFCPNDLLRVIICNIKRFIKTLKEIVDNLIIERFSSITQEIKLNYDKELLSNKISRKPKEAHDIEEYRNIVLNYQIIIVPFSIQKAMPFNYLKASLIGKYILVYGTVINVEKIQFLLKKAVYTCKSCSFQIHQENNSTDFKPILDCPTKKCKFIKSSEKFYFNTKLSIFEKVQEIKISCESRNDKVLIESKTLDIELDGFLTGVCKLKDKIKVAGIILPFNLIQTFNQNKIKRIGDEVFLKSLFIDKNLSFTLTKTKTFIIENEITNILSSNKIYDEMCRYLDSFILSNDDLKKGIILSLVGANYQTLGFKGEYNINIFILLESGIAYPNIFNLISQLTPNFSYINALFLYDFDILKNSNLSKEKSQVKIRIRDRMFVNGITYLDNIEKLSENELQFLFETTHLNKKYSTIDFKNSVDYTTLIATSRKIRTLDDLATKYWINDLFFNFDLIFCFSSIIDTKFDLKLANYIINHYKFEKGIVEKKKLFKLKTIKILISEAQKNFISISDESYFYLTYWYCNLKASLRENQKNINLFLETKTILKISSCLARIKFQSKIGISDLKETFRLLKIKINLYQNQFTFKKQKKEKAVENEIFKIVKNLFISYKKKNLKISNIEKKVLSIGFSCESLVKCINFYEQIGEITVDIENYEIKWNK